ncbi:MAG TPA: hypothetical protein VFZ53_30565 [Polyangiaceae bacterium]
MSIRLDGVPARAPETFTSSSPISPAASRPDPGPSSFELALRRIGKNVETGERIVAEAARGYAKLDTAELIALQAGIYRYSEAIDLTAKLVDRVTSAVRTVLQGGH